MYRNKKRKKTGTLSANIKPETGVSPSLSLPIQAFFWAPYASRHSWNYHASCRGIQCLICMLQHVPWFAVLSAVEHKEVHKNNFWPARTFSALRLLHPWMRHSSPNSRGCLTVLTSKGFQQDYASQPYWGKENYDEEQHWAGDIEDMDTYGQDETDAYLWCMTSSEYYRQPLSDVLVILEHAPSSEQCERLRRSWLSRLGLRKAMRMRFTSAHWKTWQIYRPMSLFTRARKWLCNTIGYTLIQARK